MTTEPSSCSGTPAWRRRAPRRGRGLRRDRSIPSAHSKREPPRQARRRVVLARLYVWTFDAEIGNCPDKWDTPFFSLRVPLGLAPTLPMPTLPNLSPSPGARERVVVTDVALRDGLQNQPQHVATAGKAALMRALAAAGVPSIEATSFVSPRAVPQMADATAVIAEALTLAPLRASALAPNLKGL